MEIGRVKGNLDVLKWFDMSFFRSFALIPTGKRSKDLT